MTQEAEVLNALRVIIDPDQGKDIVTLGFVQDLKIGEDGSVSFVLELTTPASPVKEQFVSACEEAVSALPWVTSVFVLLSAQPQKSPTQKSPTQKSPLENQSLGLQQVGDIIAVSSCKGGVGKSTIAVNLAHTLAAMGSKVGLFDADIYGPSLPTLVRVEDTTVYQQDELIVPLEHHGIKMMSFGYIPKNPGSEAAIMRGPMVTQVINQLLTGTQWGALDYLVLDMPPGTGDIQLTLTQLVPIAAAVIVTTPQQLSFIDVTKGIQMFDKVKVPTVAVVENMSYFQPTPGGEIYYLFGRGARKQLVELYGFRNSFEIPIVPELAKCCDAGTPLVSEEPDGAVADVFRELAGAVVREISTMRHAGVPKPAVSYSPGRGIVLTLPDGTEHELDPVEVRLNCRGAHSVDEFSGERLISRDDVPLDIYPMRIAAMGNYAVTIQWSHDHPASIYPYDQLMAMAA
jgi:Mrp family chromosome partitioning ATPase/DUF971 family protein